MQNDDCKICELTKEEQTAIDQLRQMMMDYPQIHFQDDDIFLAKYLRCVDWDVAVAFKRIHNVYKLKKSHPEWFANKKASQYADILKCNVRYMLDKRDKNGRRIFVYKFGNINPSMGPQLSAQLDDMWLECMLCEPETQINGISVIMDCKDIPLTILTKWLKPSYIKVGTYKADLLAVKNFDVHIVNASPIFDACMTIIQPFFSRKMKDQIEKQLHWHKKNNWPSLHEHLGRDALPEEYGGPDGQTVDYEKLYQYLYEREDFMLANRKYGIIDDK